MKINYSNDASLAAYVERFCTAVEAKEWPMVLRTGCKLFVFALVVAVARSRVERWRPISILAITGSLLAALVSLCLFVYAFASPWVPGDPMNQLARYMLLMVTGGKELWVLPLFQGMLAVWFWLLIALSLSVAASKTMEARSKKWIGY